MEALNKSQGLQANQQRLIAIAAAALVGIFLLMQAAFGSWRLAIVIFLTLPMALVGGVLAALLGGGVLTIGSLFGFFTILGIAVRNGLLMVRHLQHLAQYEDEAIGSEMVLRGAGERLTPILMTALATTVVFLPLLFGGNIAGNELVSPMAAVVLGGLLTSTLLNLFIVPALYLRWPSALPVADSTQPSAQPSLETA
jgi:Cu/Ag efflux pump CusA